MCSKYAWKTFLCTGQLCRHTAHEQDGGRFSKWPPFHMILVKLTQERLKRDVIWMPIPRISSR